MLSGSRDGGWRASQPWLAASGRWRTPDEDAALSARHAPDPVRFGFTVGKRYERRSVMRALVKRVMREACRHALPSLVAAGPGVRIDVVMRLKAPLPDRSQMGLAPLKRELRRQADALLASLRRALQARASAQVSR